MLSSTAPEANQRLLITGDPGIEEGIGGGYGLGARALNAEQCSPAGLSGRPWLSRLRSALEQRAFVLHFQPIVRLSDRSVAHHEALLRLADEPGGRLVAPGLFLPAAERSGLVRAIDRMVLEQVIALLGERGGAQRLAVNVSALSLTDETLLEFIRQRLCWHRVAPAQLIVEVTETAAIPDMQSAKRFCAGVLALGCELALDDFGAGFGSFQYLRHLPFSHLKIDGEFIRLLPVSRTDQLLVSALAGVVRGMGAQTIAEFVGDEMTIAMLREFGVDYAQGFAIGRPQPTLPATPRG